jgi:hypothetical protein
MLSSRVSSGSFTASVRGSHRRGVCNRVPDLEVRLADLGGLELDLDRVDLVPATARRA